MALKVNIFYSHSVTERLAIVKSQGEFISRIKYYGFFIDLYTLDHTYVEVYHNWHNGHVEEVEILDEDLERLHLFGVAVNLADLFKK
jgi:hypothetical protein